MYTQEEVNALLANKENVQTQFDISLPTNAGFTSSDLMYCKDTNGRVTIRGYVSGVFGIKTTNVIAQIPIGFRPLKNIGIGSVGFTDPAALIATSEIFPIHVGAITDGRLVIGNFMNSKKLEGVEFSISFNTK